MASAPKNASSNLTVRVPWKGNILTTNGYELKLNPSSDRISCTPRLGDPKTIRIVCLNFNSCCILDSSFFSDTPCLEVITNTLFVIWVSKECKDLASSTLKPQY